MPAAHLVDVIDFKWLLAGMGHRVHVERLLADPGYARHYLALAAAAPGAELREAAARVGRQLGFDVPAAPQVG
jgi:hypothetical protein